MRQISAVILILLLTVAPSCNFFKNKGIFGKKAKTLEALLALQDSIRVADSISKVQENSLTVENAKIDSIRLAQVPIQPVQALKKTGRYNIIVGSFLTPEYARSFAESYRQKGYDPQILKKKNSSFELVSAESHESIGKAIKRLKHFQDSVESWMYTQE